MDGGELKLSGLSKEDRTVVLDLAATKIAEAALKEMRERWLPRAAETAARDAVARMSDEQIWPMVKEKLEKGWRNYSGEGQAPLDEMIQAAFEKASSIHRDETEISNFIRQEVEKAVHTDLRKEVDALRKEFRAAVEGKVEEVLAQTVKSALHGLLARAR